VRRGKAALAGVNVVVSTFISILFLYRACLCLPLPFCGVRERAKNRRAQLRYKSGLIRRYLAELGKLNEGWADVLPFTSSSVDFITAGEIARDIIEDSERANHLSRMGSNQHSLPLFPPLLLCVQHPFVQYECDCHTRVAQSSVAGNAGVGYLPSLQI